MMAAPLPEYGYVKVLPSPVRPRPLVLFILFVGLLMAVLTEGLFGTAWRSTEPASQTRRTVPDPPTRLQSGLELVGASAEGKNGLIVRSVDAGWEAGYRGATLFQQGDLRRIWLAAAVLKAVDAGELSMSQRGDLIGSSGGSATIGDLLHRAVVDNEPEAQDLVLAGLGGPAAISEFMGDAEIFEVSYGAPNKSLAETPQASGLGDAATPGGLANAVARLVDGQVLSRKSSKQLFAYFSPSTAALGLPPGWSMSEFTGTAPGGPAPVEISSSLGLVRTHDGQTYAIAVMCAGGSDPGGRRQEMVRSVIAELLRTHRRR